MDIVSPFRWTRRDAFTRFLAVSASAGFLNFFIFLLSLFVFVFVGLQFASLGKPQNNDHLLKSLEV